MRVPPIPDYLTQATTIRDGLEMIAMWGDEVWLFRNNPHHDCWTSVRRLDHSDISYYFKNYGVMIMLPADPRNP